MKLQTIALVSWLMMLSGCGPKNIFAGSNDPLSGGGTPDNGDAATRTGLIDCTTTSWKSSNGSTRPDKFQITSQCGKTFVEPPTPERNLDVIFVLDVTGSMRSELDAVRGGISELISLMAAEKWNLRAGAIAFADEILEEHSVTLNLNELLGSMSPENANWKATPGFGGDAPEIGLAAIERGLTMLQETDPEGLVEEKILVYVSDAPAKTHSTHGFDTTHTEEAMRNFSQKLKGQPGKPSFRFLYSSTTSRKGLIDGMPTPILQLQQLAKNSQVEKVELPFPLSVQNIKTSFVATLREGAFRSETCNITHGKFTHTATGEVIVDTEANIANPLFAIPIASWRSGSYKAVIDRTCSLTGPSSSEISIELP
jgi:hypothetical protein